jgi:hypothetical protein
MKSNHLIRNSIILLVTLFLLSCKQVVKTSIKENKCDILVTNDGLFYKGQELVFDANLSEWEKILGKSREHTYNGSDGGCYVWDELGLVAETIPQDDSQEWTKTKIKTCQIYYRNLDSKIGGNGGLTDYGVKGNYRNMKLEDWNDEKYGELNTKTDKIKYLEKINKGSQKKSEFGIPYKIHTKPISLQGAIIDSTMNIEQINNQRENKKLKLAEFKPVIGGVNRSGRGNTNGIYPGEYVVETEFKNNKKFEIVFDTNDNQVIYTKIRKLSKKEIEEYKRYIK